MVSVCKKHIKIIIIPFAPCCYQTQESVLLQTDPRLIRKTFSECPNVFGVKVENDLCSRWEDKPLFDYRFLCGQPKLLKMQLVSLPGDVQEQFPRWQPEQMSLVLRKISHALDIKHIAPSTWSSFTNQDNNSQAKKSLFGLAFTKEATTFIRSWIPYRQRSTCSRIEIKRVVLINIMTDGVRMAGSRCLTINKTETLIYCRSQLCSSELGSAASISDSQPWIW